MSLRTTSRSLLAAAIATGLLASTPALAKPVDESTRSAARTSGIAGTVSPEQDLRGEHARDASWPAPGQDLRGEFARDSSWPTPEQIAAAADTPAQPAKAVPATSDDGRARTWLIVLVGLAGAAIAAGGTAGVRSHRHA